MSHLDYLAITIATSKANKQKKNYCKRTHFSSDNINHLFVFEKKSNVLVLTVLFICFNSVINIEINWNILRRFITKFSNIVPLIFIYVDTIIIRCIANNQRYIFVSKPI